MPTKKKAIIKDQQASPELITDKRALPPFRYKTFQIGLFVVVIIAIGAAIFFFTKYQDASKKSENIVGQANSVQVQDIVAKVGKLMELPSGETPTIATVSDVKKLSGQPFFADAKNGDIVLIYKDKGRAILYRPETNRIINVTSLSAANPVSVQVSPGPTISASPTASLTLKVTILNGTKKGQLTKSGETAIKNAGLDIQVVSRGNAKEDYTTSLVVDLNGNNSSSAKQIAEIVGGKVGPLPQNESKPESSEILIILGQDFADSRN